MKASMIAVMLATVSVAWAGGNTWAHAWETPPPVSTPYYELIAPARGDIPARYRYFPRGNNPRFAPPTRTKSVAIRSHRTTGAPHRAVRSVRTARPIEAKKRRCVFRACSKTGKLAGQIAGLVANAIWSRAF